MIYGNPRIVPSIGWCCTDENGDFVKDAEGNHVPADSRTGAPKSELPPLCPSCRRPLPRKR